VWNYSGDDPSSMLAYRYIENSPFIIMAITRFLAEPGNWQWTRMEIWSILAVGTILISLVVLWISTSMVRQIQAADRESADMLHKIEFTSKMATMGRLAASVAHEINNPLAIINEKAGLLSDLVNRTEDHPHREKTMQSLESIRNSVERCGKVTHRLLGFTRRLEPHVEPIQLDGLLMNVLSFTGKEVEHRNITVETSFSPGVPPVESDRGQLQQVFLNIVGNALEAVKDGDRIILGVSEQSGGFVAVTVEDNGAGIPRDKLPYIFEPYFSLKGEFGTGLGLSITYEIVRRLGGRIDVESEEGSGTKVTVVLPAAVGTGG